MTVEAIDHVNIVTDDLEGCARFYVDVIGLKRGGSPLPADVAAWLYDDAGRAVVHLNTRDAPGAYQRETASGPTTGAVHHVALRCHGHGAVADRLARHGHDHRRNEIADIGLKQIFVCDPNGVLLELNFFNG